MVSGDVLRGGGGSGLIGGRVRPDVAPWRAGQEGRGAPQRGYRTHEGAHQHGRSEKRAGAGSTGADSGGREARGREDPTKTRRTRQGRSVLERPYAAGA